MRRNRASQLGGPIALATLAAPLSASLQAFAPEAALETSIDLAAAQATYLASGAAGIITGLLLLLYVYRRRAYILWWTAGWGSLAVSLACTGRGAMPTHWGAFLFGAAQLLALVSALLFAVAADAYQPKARLRRRHALILAPLGIWFLLAPLALGTAAVNITGYLLTAITLAVAGGAHLLILRSAGLLGAGVVGTMLLVRALTNVWRVLAPDGSAAQAFSDAFLVDLALYLVTALGMQLMTFEDMTGELRRANARLETAQGELRQLVVTDALTGCRNRRFFDEIIAHELNLHRRYGTPMSLLFVDVDHFKTINDTLGHAAGDHVLREVSAFLVRKTRDADYVFRWGGDEFLLLLSCREEEAQRRGRELQVEFGALPSSKTLPQGVGLSFGCAEVSPFADTALDALKLADERMYATKRAVRLPDIKAV
jgi:diguanylate cyclase (GGDEF)-like protein